MQRVWNCGIVALQHDHLDVHPLLSSNLAGQIDIAVSDPDAEHQSIRMDDAKRRIVSLTN